MFKRYIIWNIRSYQKYISPYKKYHCPYCPSCSNYALEAVENYGVLRGGLLTLWRLLRCNPWTQGGYDPVPILKKTYKQEYKHLRMKVRN